MNTSQRGQLFEVRRSDLTESDYRVNGEHPIRIPAILCAVCRQRWIQVGLNYPTVNPSRLPDLESYFKERPMSGERFKALSNDLNRILGKQHPVKPGSTFGPMVGKIVGSPTDIAFCRSWELLLKEATYIALKDKGIKGLIGSPAQLRSRRKDAEPLMEIQLEAHGRLAKRSLPARGAPPCPSCGYQDIELPEMFWLEERSLPKDLDLFRLLDLPGYIVATERFVNVVQSLNLTGAVFEPLNVDPS